MTRVPWTGLLGVVVVALVVGIVLGWRPVVLVSDSMAPGAPAGSILLARSVAPEQVRAGDVLTVPLPAGDGRITHRVVDLEVTDGGRWVQLQGDANPTRDAGRIELGDETLRTVAVVPVLGRAVGGGSPVLIAGIVLLLVGTLGLAFVERRSRREAAVSQGRHQPRLPTGTGGLDTRTLALFATLEALADDGMDRSTLEALARARVGALLGLGAVEESPEVDGLDDGARFVVIAFADADPDALGLVPVGSRRATEAREAVAGWWERNEGNVPVAVRSELLDTLDASTAPADAVTGDAAAGIDHSGAVD